MKIGDIAIVNNPIGLIGVCKIFIVLPRRRIYGYSKQRNWELTQDAFEYEFTNSNQYAWEFIS